MQSRTSDNDLESKLAGDLRSYINASEGEEPSGAEEALRRVCSGFEYLLGSLLDQCDGWNGWVDGIIPATDMVPDAIKVTSSVALTVRGKAIWGTQPRGPFWIEPFLGSVQIAEIHDVLTGYQINFADANRGLGEFPYGKHVRRSEWLSPADWLFAFTKGSLPNKSTADNRR